MAEDFARDVGLSAAVGCATGFVWSSLAGQADLSEGKGALFAIAGCVGSAAQGTAVYSTSRVISEDPALSRQITAGWFGVQSAASFTNWLGARYGLMDRPGFNAVAIPLNYAAAPFVSTFGLLVAGTGEMIEGFGGEVVAFGGALTFRHNLCFYARYQTGAIGHKCTDTMWLKNRLHETAHTVQTSIMGEAGMLAVNIVGFGLIITERWANDYVVKTDQAPYLRRAFKLPDSADVQTSPDGFIKLRLSKPFVIDGIAYAADRPLFCGSDIHGEFKVVRGTLAQDTVIDGICYQKGTDIEFDFSRKVASPKTIPNQENAHVCERE